MGKRLFISPEVRVLKLEPITGDEEGEGSVLYTQDPMSYNEWRTEFKDIEFEFDMDPSDEPGTWNDYVSWMHTYGYDDDVIAELNPTRP